MTTEKELIKCIICSNDIKPEPWGWDQGHNAEPVKTGRCCNHCNSMIVIPTRIRLLAEKES